MKAPGFCRRWNCASPGVRPLLLGSTINKQNELLAVDLMNPDFTADGVQCTPDSIHVFRSKFIWKGNCFEQLRLTNFSLEPLKFPFSINFAADFSDIFEVRGITAKTAGDYRPSDIIPSSAILSYEGLDGASSNDPDRLCPTRRR